jgi:MarR family protein
MYSMDPALSDEGGRMSVEEELRDLERRVAGRLKELRPLVDEYHELERIARRLGLDDGASAGGEAPAKSRGASARRSRGGRAPGKRSQRHTGPPGAQPSPNGRRGTRRPQVLDAVHTHPGITVRELGAELGVDPTSLYRYVRALEADGEIKKDGLTLHPA